MGWGGDLRSSLLRFQDSVPCWDTRSAAGNSDRLQTALGRALQGSRLGLK